MSRSRRQTLHHYLPRFMAGTLSVAVFCLTGILAAIDPDQQSAAIPASAPTGTVRSAEPTAVEQFGGP